MRNYKFLSVIMVLVLCLCATQSVDAKKKKTRKRVPKTEKKQMVTEMIVVEDDEVLPSCNSVDCVEDKDQGQCTVLKSATHMPEYPGGTSALMHFLNMNVQYPQAAQDNGIEGKVVVQFVVEKDGSVGEIKVARGVDPNLDKEAVRVCKLLPKFSPGRNADGDPVRVWYTLPITFKLQRASEEKSE